MKKYRVLKGKEITLHGETVVGGQEVELNDAMAKPFVEMEYIEEVVEKAAKPSRTQPDSPAMKEGHDAQS